MVTYQVEYRAYHARYEGNPPDWTAAPLSSVMRTVGEGREVLRYYLERVKSRAEVARGKEPAIVEVRLVCSDGRVINTRKIRLDPIIR